MYMSNLPSLAPCVHAGFMMIIFVKWLQNQPRWFQTELSKCEEIKSSFISLAKHIHQRSSGLFENESIKCKACVGELSSQALKLVK